MFNISKDIESRDFLLFQLADWINYDFKWSYSLYSLSRSITIFIPYHYVVPFCNKNREMFHLRVIDPPFPRKMEVSTWCVLFFCLLRICNNFHWSGVLSRISGHVICWEQPCLTQNRCRIDLVLCKKNSLNSAGDVICNYVFENPKQGLNCKKKKKKPPRNFTIGGLYWEEEITRQCLDYSRAHGKNDWKVYVRFILFTYSRNWLKLAFSVSPCCLFFYFSSVYWHLIWDTPECLLYLLNIHRQICE